MRKRILSVLFAAIWCLAANATPLRSGLSYRRFTTHDGLPQMQTETIWQDSRGYIYIGTLSGFVRYDGADMTTFLRGKRENIVMFRETEGQVLAMGFVRQWRIKGDKVEESKIDPNGLLLNNLNAADLPDEYILLEDRQEQNRSLRRLTDGGMTPVLETPLLDDMTPDRKLYVDAGGIYIPTPHGLYLADRGQIRRMASKGDVFSLCRTGESLFALAADGIYRVDGDSLVLRCGIEFEAPDYGLSVRKDRQGRLIIADSHTIWRYDGNATEPLRQLASGFNMIRAVFVDKWNRLWVATYQGVYCFFHCNFTGHRLEDPNDIVRAIVACDGHLVMGTLNGKVLVDGEVVSDEEGNFYSPGGAAVDGKVYLAGNGDVAVIQDGSLSWLGLPYDRYRFVAGASGRVVIGTSRSLLSYDPSSGRLDTLSMEIARPWCAATDGQGRLWVSGNPGLYCLTGFAEGKTAVEKVVSTPNTGVITSMASDGERVCYAIGDALYLIRDGQPSEMKELSEALSGHEIRSLHLSRRGYLVVAAIDGLLVARISRDSTASDIHWFDDEGGFTNIEPLLGPMAEEEDGTVWLAGLEEMTSFRPDDLIADNQEPTIVEKPLPWYRRWWAIALGLCLLAGLVWLVTRMAVKRQLRRKMESLEREKKQKELQLSAVRLKSIPHFHSNVLSSIEYFIMNKSSDEAARYLKLYSDFTNQTLSDIDRPARTVAEEVEYTRTYLELEQLRYGERLVFNITVDPQLNQQTLLPTMLLHTYCQNAVKHGIASKGGVGTVEVSVVREQRQGSDGVLVTVTDDGVGREAAARSGGYSTKQGLKILQQQIELYNRANRHHIVQEVIDLTDSEGRPSGTCFRTWVPSDYQY